MVREPSERFVDKQPRFTKNPEMVGDVALAGTGRFDQVAGTQLLITEEVDDLRPQGVSKCSGHLCTHQRWLTSSHTETQSGFGRAVNDLSMNIATLVADEPRRGRASR